MRKLIRLVLSAVSALALLAPQAAAGEDFLMGVWPEASEITPAFRSEEHPGHENCYWCTPMDLSDEEKIWAMLTAPVTVVDVDMMKQVVLYAQPDEDSEKIGVITGQSQAVHVLENVDNGWSRVETYSTSFHDSRVKNWNGFVTGYIQTKRLKTVQVNQKYGLIIDKLTQRLYFFEDGHLKTSLAVSTGLYNDRQPYNETRSGEYLLLYYRKGDLPEGRMHCYYPIRFNAADYLHEVPCDVPSGGKRSDANYSRYEPKLGERASHGCIRVQRLKNADGYNMYEIFQLLKNRKDKHYPKMVIWEDYQGRQVSIPSDEVSLYYNPNGGSFYHSVANCPGVRKKFLPLTGFTYGELEDETFAKLTPCPNCQPTPRKAVLEEINRVHMESSPGEVMSYWQE